MASGLIALVDDCIKHHFHIEATAQSRELRVPIPRVKVGVDMVGVKGLFKDMLHRSAYREQEADRRPTSLRHSSHLL